jgi:beta-glucosidase
MYLRLPKTAGEPFQRLAGWKRFSLGPGETCTVTVAIDPAYISVFDEEQDHWRLVPGDYTVSIGGSSDEIVLVGKLHLGN